MDDSDEKREAAFVALEGLATDVVAVLGQMVRGEIACSPADRLAACQMVLMVIGVLPVPGMTMACDLDPAVDVGEPEDDFDEAIRRSAEDYP